MRSQLLGRDHETPHIGESVVDVEAGGTCAGWSLGGIRGPGSLSGALSPCQCLWGLKTTGGGPADGNQNSRLGLEAGPEIWSRRNGSLLNGNLMSKNCVAVGRDPRLATTFLKKVKICRVKGRKALSEPRSPAQLGDEVE